MRIAQIMCLMVYIASSRCLPTIPWDKDKPAFYVEALPHNSGTARQQFSKSQVYRLGSHHFCGCGFRRQELLDTNLYPNEHEAAEKSRTGLVEFLDDALKEQDSLEIWLCWSGDEACKPEKKARVHPSEFLDPSIFEQEKVLLTVTDAAD